MHNQSDPHPSVQGDPMIDIDEKQVGTDDSGRLIIEWDLDAAER
jgi:hypothetical protein